MTSKGAPTQMPERKPAFKKQNTRRSVVVHDWSFPVRVSPWDLERLIPVKSQVVMESCKGNIFKCDVVSLRRTREHVLSFHPWGRVPPPTFPQPDIAALMLDSTLVFSLLLRLWIIDGQVSAHSPGGFIGGAFSRQSNIRPQPAFRKLCASCDFIAVTVVVLFTWIFWVFFWEAERKCHFRSVAVYCRFGTSEKLIMWRVKTDPLIFV